jgi:hypothetical protein
MEVYVCVVPITSSIALMSASAYSQLQLPTKLCASVSEKDKANDNANRLLADQKHQPQKDSSYRYGCASFSLRVPKAADVGVRAFSSSAEG